MGYPPGRYAARLPLARGVATATMLGVTDPGRTRGKVPGASVAYPALARSVTTAYNKHARIANPLERTVAYSELLRALQEQIEIVSAERDAALVEVLAAATHPSHRALARDLHLSRQRVDQLAAIARRGGRRRRG